MVKVVEVPAGWMAPPADDWALVRVARSGDANVSGVLLNGERRGMFTAVNAPDAATAIERAKDWAVEHGLAHVYVSRVATLEAGRASIINLRPGQDYPESPFVLVQRQPERSHMASLVVTHWCGATFYVGKTQCLVSIIEEALAWANEHGMVQFMSASKGGSFAKAEGRTAPGG